MTQRALPNKFHAALNLYRLSVKRTAGITLLLTVFSLLFCPGYVIMEINRERTYANVSNISGKIVNFAEFYPLLIVIATVATTAAALLYLFINFSFLYSRSSSDFFHALPVKRGRLLFSRFAASVVPIMLPIAITYISMGCITKLKYVTGSVKPIALGFCANVLVMLACCAFSLIFIVCAGSVFDLILSFFTFNAGTLLLQIINAELINQFLFGSVTADYSRLLLHSSPFYYAFAQLFSLRKFTSARPLMFFGIKLLILAALSLAAAFLLYNRRRSEKSGVTYAYKFLYVICLFIVGFIGAYCLGIIFSSGEYTVSFWIFAALGALLSAVTFGAISDRGFKTVKKSLITGGCSFAAMACAVIILITGGFGYASRIPKKENISSASLTLFGSDGMFEFKDPAAIIRLHEKIIENRSLKNYDGGYIAIDYNLKNGDAVRRQYYIDYNKYKDLLLPLYKSDEYIESLKKEFFKDDIYDVYVDIEYKSANGVLSAEEIRTLIAAYISDLPNAEGGVATGENAKFLSINYRSATNYNNCGLYIENSFKNTLAVIDSLPLNESEEEG